FYECERAKRVERLNKIIIDCDDYKNIAELPYKSLEDVHKVFLRWFPHLNTTRIDTRLAWYISNESGLGDSLWICESARSGFTKSTLSESMNESPKVIPVGSLTTKALISGQTQRVGKKDVPVPDFGMRLHRRNRCLNLTESASQKAMHDGSKRDLFSYFKMLYDGYLKKDTGTGVSKLYEGCNTSLWINSTPDFQKEVIIQQEIGTCLLVDYHPLNRENDEEATRKAIRDRDKRQQIKEETTNVVKCYLAHHHLKDIQFDAEEEKFFVKEANRLAWIRTTGSFDYKDELEYTPQPEFPPRLGKQLSKLYQALMSLDEKYDKERVKRIIRRIVDGSGDLVMVKILEYINARYWTIKEAKDENTPFTVTDIVVSTGLGTRTIKRRLEILTALKFLRKSWKASEKVSEKVSEGKKKGGGGPSGYQYKLRDDIIGKDWESLFRHRIFKK
ncbi:MAG: hypothetical protein KAR55_01910, partial [Thermoplasmatales archaeon]|nr:hypothetical protein [Thermoplasmatales archaeon]